MASLADLIFIIQLFVAVSPSSMALKQCKVKNTSKPGFFLVGYALKSFTAERLAFCYSTCNTDPSCQSLNYNLASKTCQLNSESRKSQPNSFHAREGSVYSDNPDRGKSFKALIWYFMKKMSLPIRFHDCLSNSASSLQVTTVFHFFGSRGRVLLIFDSFESSFVQYLN